MSLGGKNDLIEPHFKERTIQPGRLTGPLPTNQGKAQKAA